MSEKSTEEKARRMNKLLEIATTLEVDLEDVFLKHYGATRQIWVVDGYGVRQGSASAVVKRRYYESLDVLPEKIKAVLDPIYEAL